MPALALVSAMSCATACSTSAGSSSISTRSSPIAMNGTAPSRKIFARAASNHSTTLLAENEESSYVAYVSQQNLLADAESGPVDHPNVDELFEQFKDGRYRMRRALTH